jgi:hypothetical protein
MSRSSTADAEKDISSRERSNVSFCPTSTGRSLSVVAYTDKADPGRGRGLEEGRRPGIDADNSSGVIDSDALRNQIHRRVPIRHRHSRT